MIIPININARN